MNKGITLLALGSLAILMLFSVRSEAQITAGADLAMDSKYLWRGMSFNDEPVFVPDFWISWKGFTATVFGALELTDVYQRRNQFTEVDYYLEYSRSFGPLDATLGYGHYFYPHTGLLSTGEAYAKFGTDLGFLEASVEVYYDTKEARGVYLSSRLSRTLEFVFLQPTLALSVGYADKMHNRYYFLDSTSTGIDHAGFCDLTSSLGLSYTPPGSWGDYLTINGDLNYSYLLDGQLAAAFPDLRGNFWWGLGISVTPIPDRR
jgi:hypothetical protein